MFCTCTEEFLFGAAAVLLSNINHTYFCEALYARLALLEVSQLHFVVHTWALLLHAKSRVLH